MGDMGLRFFLLRPAIFLFLLLVSLLRCATASVTYDERAIMVNGQRRVLISGSIHYPRSTPEVLHNANMVHGFFSPFLLGSNIYMFTCV